MSSSTDAVPGRHGTRAGEEENIAPRLSTDVRRLIGAGACALLLAAPAADAFAQAAPPWLDLVRAEIREVPPIHPDVGSRTVKIELTLAGAPVCTGSSPFTVYGILIDADLDPNTGITHSAFDPLGVDARISAECDQSVGQFVSEAGLVVVGAPGPGGETLLTISTTVAALPAVEFDWFAFAVEDADLFRLPDGPGVARWAIHERSLW